jgi:hypothetical protein
MTEQSRSMRAALWADPGGTTGLALWDFVEQRFNSTQLQFRETGALVEDLVTRYGSDFYLGYEQFTITPGRQIKHDGSALMVIGMLRWLTVKHNVAMLPSQPPSARRLGLKHLKTLGWYRAGQQHGMDAAGHLATWAITNDLLPEELKERLRDVSSGA